MPNYEEIIQQSQANVKSLSEKLKDLDKLHQEIKLLKESAEGIPEAFNKKFQELVNLSEGYTNILGATTKNYLDGNNNLLTIKLNELTIKLNKFENEITRLVNTDFNKLFEVLQKVFIDQTREDLKAELKRFEEKSKDLQIRIGELKTQIDRLEEIDLEKHFDKLQKTLSEIFGAINAINVTFTSIIQTLTGIVQSLGSIQTTIDNNHKEAKQLLQAFVEAAGRHFADIEKQASRNLEILENKMKILSEQNELLKKGVRTNRVIQIVGFAIVLLTIIYFAVLKQYIH